MIEYCVYYRDESVMMGDKPFSWMIGRFTDEKYANIFIKAVRKADIQSKNITYFIDKWDTEKMTFVK
mgnify:CR=1 FL=1